MNSGGALLHAARLCKWITLRAQAAVCRFALDASHLYTLSAGNRTLWFKRGRCGFREHFKLFQYASFRHHNGWAATWQNLLLLSKCFQWRGSQTKSQIQLKSPILPTFPFFTHSHLTTSQCHVPVTSIQMPIPILSALRRATGRMRNDASAASLL